MSFSRKHHLTLHIKSVHESENNTQSDQVNHYDYYEENMPYENQDIDQNYEYVNYNYDQNTEDYSESYDAANYVETAETVSC